MFENLEKSILGSAVVYCRVSTMKQAQDGHGLDTQLNVCQNRCDRNHVPIARVFTDEGISGSDLDRKGLNDLLAYLKQSNR